MDTRAAHRSTTLQDLAQLTRKAKHLVQERHAQDENLRRLRWGNQLLLQLCRTMRDIHGRLVGYVRVDSIADKRAFCDVYKAMMEQADAIMEFVDSEESQIHTGFLHELDPESADAILQFLQVLRADHDWISGRLSRLSTSELDQFVSFTDSDNRQGNLSKESRCDRDYISSLQRSSPLNTLLFGIFANPGSSTREDDLRLQMTSSILQTLMKENKTSTKGEKLCLAVFDTWAALYGWEPSKAFELLLMKILQKGTHIIEKTELRNSQNNFNVPGSRPRYYNHTKRDEVEDEFFTGSVRDILRLLNESDSHGLPAGVQSLARVILSEVDESDRRYYESYILVNWFFRHFLARAVVNPEVSLSQLTKPC